MSTSTRATPTPPDRTERVPTWTVTAAQRADLQVIAEGGYAPLTGFMTREQVTGVRTVGRLDDGIPWTVPVVLTVDVATADAVAAHGRLDLLDEDGTPLGRVAARSVWRDDAGSHVGGDVEVADPRATTNDPGGRGDPGDPDDPSAGAGPVETAGPVVVARPVGFVDAATAARWSRAVEALAGRLLLRPAVGAEPEHRRDARIRSYRALLPSLPGGTKLRVLPCHRDPTDRGTALLHATVARNAGATHLLVDDHLDAAAIRSIGLTPVDPACFAEPSDPPAGVLHDAVAVEHRKAHPPRSAKGIVVMFTGLSGSGKSTVAKVLAAGLAETGDRRVTLLDGDLVRRHLSSELGFSREHRDLNVRRIGYVASEIAKHGGTAVCAPIAPYDRTRREVRKMALESGGGFVLVHVSTPLEICEARDVKGLYARARAGRLAGFTGIDDPYEPPSDAEVVVDTSVGSPADAAAAVLAHLVAEGWLVR